MAKVYHDVNRTRSILGERRLGVKLGGVKRINFKANSSNVQFHSHPEKKGKLLQKARKGPPKRVDPSDPSSFKQCTC